MIGFNPSFNFGNENISLPVNTTNIAKDSSYETYKIDKIIDEYRRKNISELSENLVEEYEVEESSHGLQCSVSDFLRTKSKLNKNIEKNPEVGKRFEFAQSLEKYTEVDSFISFKLSKPILKALTEMQVFKPTPIQCACIPLALLNRDICACARTGSGKTLAFLIPIVERMVYSPHASLSTTKALIISPTRELAVQIFKVAELLVRHCSRLKLQLAAGGLDSNSQEASLRTNPDIVVATPGRLIDHLSNVPNFTLSGVEYLVLDEADKLLDDYFTEQIKEIVRHCRPQRQTLLFSATMSESVHELATVSLKDPVRISLNPTTAVANRLDQEFVRIRSHREGDRDAMLVALLVRSFPHRTIVFLPTKKDCHRMHILLGLLGIKCVEMHGDMNQEQRLVALRRFTDSEALKREAMDKAGSEVDTDNRENSKNLPPADILLATDLASRGLDIPGVQTVINYKLPNNIKSYVHRVGRTARASNSGRAVSLAGEADRKLLKEILKGAPRTVKARVIPQDVIARFQARIDKAKPLMDEILATELEEHELNAALAQLAKVESLALHGKAGTTVAKPRRVNWFSEKRDLERAAKRSKKQRKR